MLIWIGAAAAIWGVFIVSPWGTSDRALYRGWLLQGPLMIAGNRYSVNYTCKNRRASVSVGDMAHALVGIRYNHFFAWDDDGAMRFAQNAKPACRMYRLNRLERPWVIFRSRYSRHRYEQILIFGPDQNHTN